MTFRRLAAALAAAGILLATVAHADEAQEIGKLLKAGQHAQALERADKFLAGNPKDAQVRFLKGLIYTEQSRSAEAIKVFTGLTEDYPELPEPYNNLAVLYANQNQLDKARVALQMAIQTNPAYSTAHENLGDLYAKLASQAYDRALQLEKGNNTAQTKLSLVRELFSRQRIKGTQLAAAPTPPSKPAAVIAPPQIKPATPLTPATPAISAPITVAGMTPAKIEAAKPAAKPEIKAETKPEIKVEPKPEPKAESKADNDEAAVLKVVNAWAAAWSDQKVSSYLAAYGKGFKVPGGDSRSEWEKQRRERISQPKHIDVQLAKIKVSVDGDEAMVRFVQNYRADALKKSTIKTLLLQKNGGRWLIKEERVG